MRGEQAPIRSFLDRAPKRLATAINIIKQEGWQALLRVAVNRFLLPGVSKITKPLWFSKLRAAIDNSPADRPPVLILATCDYRFPYRQRCQHLAKAIASLGHVVVYGSPLTGYDSVLGFWSASERLIVVNYRTRWQDLLPGNAIVLVMSTDNQLGTNFLPEAQAQQWKIIYDYIDEIDPRISLGPISENHLMAHSDLLKEESVLVVCVAPNLMREARTYRTKNLALVPNGVDCAHYKTVRNYSVLPQEMRAIVDLAKPIVGYFGALACWLDFDLVSSVARARRDFSFVLIGPDFDGSLAKWRRENRALPENLFILPPFPYHTLPNLAVWFDVGMIPFVVNKITAATSPLKLYEYFALQIPVVSSPLPDCERYADVVAVADGSENFAQAVDSAVARSSNTDIRQRLSSYAARSDWQSRASEILKLSTGLKTELCRTVADRDAT
ncbi:hypothetical protein DLM45_05010 [Hyphomicrobium methylovorum]|uniref:hypothetical protein n=1 Tax=Hyphomicrobium methylovorum TaxID=84 RepID=UPI0015E6CE67|nr:hypothetical protein [Hyphomicrobium methylovorum]MBA2125584.1 hypothetical protein [Hyphomicrobium methylovorum]